MSQSMEKNSYLVFSLHDSRYGIRVGHVAEILMLPELKPVTEAPPYISGMFNFRGRIVPVMDLHVRLGHRGRHYRLNDRLIVLEWGEMMLGLVVNQVHDVIETGPELLEPPPTYGLSNGDYSRFFEGMAKLRDEIITLLNLEQLVRQSAPLRNLYRDEDDIEEPEEISTLLSPDEHPAHMPNIDESERVILRERALNLLREADKQDFTGHRPYALVELGGEYYGVELDIVREFTNLGNLTPVPCCPDHIVGCMNRRGFILTVADIRGLLNLPILRENLLQKKVVVVNIGEIYAGVLVDDVLDVLHISSDEIGDPPSAVASGPDAHIRGACLREGRTVGLLDMRKILLSGDLVVNETV